MVGVPESARRHGIRPSKTLGQNFLVDPNTIRRIVRLAEVTSGDRIVEVGAGLGTMTTVLAEKAERVVAIELDRALLLPLREALAGFTNVEIVRADAMKLDFASVLKGTGWRLVSNLPYNVATPLIARLVEELPAVDDFVVMVQREAGERLVSPPGSKEYGAVSVLVSYFCSGRILGRVPPTVFWPKPKVESVLVRLVRRAPPVDVAIEDLMKVVRGAFGQRRKTVRNALAAALGLPAAEVEKLLSEAGVDAGSRAETLAIGDFARIAKAIGKANLLWTSKRGAK